jgi:hypothetical protein
MGWVAPTRWAGCWAPPRQDRRFRSSGEALGLADIKRGDPLHRQPVAVLRLLQHPDLPVPRPF